MRKAGSDFFCCKNPIFMSFCRAQRADSGLYIGFVQICIGAHLRPSESRKKAIFRRHFDPLNNVQINCSFF